MANKAMGMQSIKVDFTSVVKAAEQLDKLKEKMKSIGKSMKTSINVESRSILTATDRLDKLTGKMKSAGKSMKTSINVESRSTLTATDRLNKLTGKMKSAGKSMKTSVNVNSKSILTATNRMDKLAGKMKSAGKSEASPDKDAKGGKGSIASKIKSMGSSAFNFINNHKDAVISTGRDLLGQADEGMAADMKLDDRMKNVQGTSPAQISSLKDYAAALQKVGVIGDNVGKSGMAQLASYNLQAGSIKTLTKGMYDLAVEQNGANVSAEQMQGIADIVGKSMGGNADALTNYGMKMTETQKQQLKYGNEAQRAAAIADVLASNVGGMNEAMAATPGGAMALINNNFNAMKENLGKQLLPVLVSFSQWFVKNLPTVEGILQGAMGIAVGLFDGLGSAIDWAKQNAGWLIPVISGVAAAVGTLVIIETISGMMQRWQEITEAMKIVQEGLNLAMDASPWGLVVLGIGLLVAAGVALYKNWDTVKAKAGELWEGISNLFKSGVDFIINLINIHVIGGLNNLLSKFPGIQKLLGINHIDPLPIFQETIKGNVVHSEESMRAIHGDSYASGINRGPHDMPAYIHKDEAVIPAKYNPYNPNAKAAGGGVNVTVNINGYNKSTKEIINEFVPQLKLAMANM